MFQYFLLFLEIKDYNLIIEERNFFDQPIKKDLKTYDNIRKIATGQVNDYTTGCLLDYPYFKHTTIATYLSKQQKLDAPELDDPKVMQWINFTGNLDRAEDSTMFFIVEKSKRKSFRFFKRSS